MNRINRFFWICSGAHIDTLGECPSESSKYAGIGATIFFTGVFATIAAGYALFTVFDNVIWAILFGLFWGLMIFNLDRYIVSSMRKEGSGWRQFLTATPRIILAVIISLVIAKPLELKIFEKEIEEELLTMHQEKKKAQELLVDERYGMERSAAEQEIRSLQDELDEKAAVRDDLARIAREEADGTGGTMQRSAGPIYRIKKADADRAEVEYKELFERNTALMEREREKIAQLDMKIQADKGTLNEEVADGPAARMEALSRITAESRAIWMANLFIILLFLAVETAPIFVKLISHKGPYDHKIRVVEFPYTTERVTALATETDEARKRVEGLSDHDREIANKELDALLRSG